jgi:hypothetical protein
MRFMKTIAAAAAVSLAALSFAGTAQAERYHRYYHHHDNGGAVAAGIFGLAAGAIVGSALSQPRYIYCTDGYRSYPCPAPAPEPVYVAPPPAPYYEPAPAAYAGPQAWSPEWYSYCESRYRSFDSRTGYFLGYDGQYHFCR